MVLLFKVVTYPILVARVGSLSMEGHLLTKTSQEHTHVQGYCQWRIVEGIPIRHNFSSRWKHVHILMANMLYLDKLLMACKWSEKSLKYPLTNKTNHAYQLSSSIVDKLVIIRHFWDMTHSRNKCLNKFVNGNKKSLEINIW